MAFTNEQYEQVKKQLNMHNRGNVKVNLVLDEKSNNYMELIVEKGVFGSDIMSSGLYLARFLYNNFALYKNKEVLDMGCGPGTQGIIMAKYGAKRVVLTDINKKAVENTKKNIKILGLKNAEVYASNLFDNIKSKFDVIVFNHPFFSGNAEDFKDDSNNDIMLRRSMLGGTELIKKFFRDAGTHLKDKGIIIMPYFHFAGPENNPANHVANYNLKIQKEYKLGSKEGLQLGDFSFYIITY